jgi:uncharacterized membrane protein
MVDSRPAPGASTPSRRSLAWARPRAGLPPLWVMALVLAIGIPNIAAALSTIETIVTQGYAFDWTNFLRAADRLPAGTLYDFSGNYAFRWSPLAAWAFGFIAPIGLLAWRLAHMVVLGFLRDWRLIVVVLLSYPFWFDVETGNINTFVAVAAVCAWRGSRVATAIYLLLFLLVPRPLAAPLAFWILWKRPEWRWPFVVAALAEVAVVVAMGLGTEWLGALLGAESELHADLNLAPSAIIGAWWLPIGTAAAIWCTYRGRLGLASIAASPYWLPYYFLMLLLELVLPAERDQRSTQTAAVASA